jgi:hypothetical protein
MTGYFSFLDRLIQLVHNCLHGLRLRQVIMSRQKNDHFSIFFGCSHDPMLVSNHLNSLKKLTKKAVTNTYAKKSARVCLLLEYVLVTAEQLPIARFPNRSGGPIAGLPSTDAQRLR